MKNKDKKNRAFVGRQRELSLLRELRRKKTSSLVAVKGRRRVGKSRLIEHFGEEFDQFLEFSGLYPEEGISAQDQREAFENMMRAQLSTLPVKSNDWQDLFYALAQHTKEGSILILLDEISWMAHDDVTFLPKLKNAWDLYFKHNQHLVLVLCGSVSSWIQKNIISSSGFFGRVSLNLTLKELNLYECNVFWEGVGVQISAREKLKTLSITGGIPKYLEEINPAETTEKNVQRLAFLPSGILFNDFDEIFSKVLLAKSQNYRHIVDHLAKGPSQQEDIFSSIEQKSTGRLSEYLEELKVADFISRDFTWHLRDGAVGKLSQYRLSDNYLRFYLKYISPNKSKIENFQFDDYALSALPSWEAILGLQFENLVLHNRKLIKECLGLKPEDIICDNPFFQRKTKRNPGCQIDYLIQTKFNNLFVCEVKFSRNVISSSVISEVKNKISKIKVPRGFSYFPVLIYSGALSPDIEDSRFFYKLINVEDFLI